MEISLLNSLFHISSLVNIDCELVHKYYRKTEDILELLKPILNVFFGTEIVYVELFQSAFDRLGYAVDELRKLLESWQLLSCRVYFVLQIEALVSKVQNYSLEIIELLVASDQHLPAKLSLISLQNCAQKMKSIDCELLSTSITIATTDCSEYISDSDKNIANCLCLKSNQDFLIELVALEKLKENAAKADDEVEYIEQIIAVVTRMHDNFVTIKISNTYPLPIPADFLCPLSLKLMMDPVIIESGHTYERVFIKEWIGLGLTVCPKTRKTLAHTRFLPNYTAKALISHWLESNNMKLSDLTESLDVERMSVKSSEDDMANLEDRSLSSLTNYSTRMSSVKGVSTHGSFRTTPTQTSYYPSPASTRNLSSLGYSISSPYHPRLSLDESYPGTAFYGLKWDFERMSVQSFEGDMVNTEDTSMNLLGYNNPMRLFLNSLSSTVKYFLPGHNVATYASSPDSIPTRRSSVSYPSHHLHSSSEVSFLDNAGDVFGWISPRGSEDRNVVDSVRHSPLWLSTNSLSSSADQDSLHLGLNRTSSASTTLSNLDYSRVAIVDGN